MKAAGCLICVPLPPFSYLENLFLGSDWLFTLHSPFALFVFLLVLQHWKLITRPDTQTNKNSATKLYCSCFVLLLSPIWRQLLSLALCCLSHFLGSPWHKFRSSENDCVLLHMHILLLCFPLCVLKP